ncbi:MAG: PhzF family phenazine biosynthesis isomerase [Anaerolineaceae bacterium]|nr:PhzF family phenazine biosynthesis isomerase [Anaerolineaceae bacterium]
MRRLHYHLLDVFTNERFGGNPLAVFINGRGLETALMQRIAKELNLSEVTFVLPPENPDNDWKVRIFTPSIELPMAGHPTVGTSYILAREDMVGVSESHPVIKLEEGVGIISVTFQFNDGMPSLIQMQQPLPTFSPEFTDRALAAELLSLQPDDLADYPVQVVSCGVPFLFIPVKSLAAVQKIKFRMDIWERSFGDYPQMFVFTTETTYPTSTVHSRMFAPGMGIAEDPATGAASGPLGCYLVKYGLVKDDPAKIISEQGFEMGRPSYIHIEIRQTDGAIYFVGVGGECVYIGEGSLEI